MREKINDKTAFALPLLRWRNKAVRGRAALFATGKMIRCRQTTPIWLVGLMRRVLMTLKKRIVDNFPHKLGV
ncbi:hypothetical protein H650_02160 [Enterobacter sp. R4-368]|nr:hypothetical protein H650_02160 [Enterobacter sp. R4-368]